MKKILTTLLLLTCVSTLASAGMMPKKITQAMQNHPLSQNGTWTLQQALTQNVANSEEGFAVALSADGNTLAAGAPGVPGLSGETQIYTRSGNVWTYQTILSQGVAGSSEGASVALSADGNTLVAGALIYGSNQQGATQVYTRSGTNWAYQATLSQDQESSWEGCSVALSADGSTLAAGAPSFYNRTGATQIYILSGGTWTYQATLSQLVANSYEGYAVALSADGNTLAVGAPGVNIYTGETHIYVRSGNMWTHQATLSQNGVSSREGAFVALSGDGNTLAAGAWDDNNGQGATQIYVRSGSTWTYQATLSQSATNLNEGHGVALSANATTLAVGTDFNPGVTFIYVN